MPGILVTGASGQLGAYLLRHLAAGPGPVAAWSGSRSGERSGVPLRQVDLCDGGRVRAALAEARPEVVLHAGAWARLADCHRDPGGAERVNVAATALLARECARLGARLVFVSTDLVFDGLRAPYREDDPVSPLSVYGRTKARAEEVVRATPGGLVARVSLLVGPSLAGAPSFFDEQVAALRGGRPVPLFTDEWRTPLDYPTAARALVALAGAPATGTVHLGGPERLSRLEMGERLARVLGAGAGGLLPRRREEVPAAEPRPADVSLACPRFRSLFPDFAFLGHDDALRAMLGAS